MNEQTHNGPTCFVKYLDVTRLVSYFVDSRPTTQLTENTTKVCAPRTNDKKVDQFALMTIYDCLTGRADEWLFAGAAATAAPPTMLCCVVAVVLCLFVVGPDSRTGFVHLVGMGSRRASNKPSPLSVLFIVSLLLCSLLSRKSALSLSSSTQSPNVLYFVRLFCFGLVHPSSLVASAGILATKPHERIQSICSTQTQQPTI